MKKYAFKAFLFAPLLAIPAFLYAAVPGTLDNSFDSDGKLTTELGTNYSIALAVIQQTDGKLVAAGLGKNTFEKEHIAVARYHPDGRPDSDDGGYTGFNIDGKAETPVGFGDAAAFAIVQQNDNKLVAAGRSYNIVSGNDDFTLIRYTTAGALDSSFNSTGQVMTHAGFGNSGAYAVILDSNSPPKADTLTAAGYSRSFGNDNFALVRYNLNGSLDTSFSGGIVATDFGNNGDDQAFSLIKQNDGKLVAAGYSNNGTNDDFAVARYNANGTPDTGFSGDGKVRTSVGSGLDRGLSVIQQFDGKLVVAGYSTVNSRNVISLVRYNSNGSLDTGFSSDGKVTTAIGTIDDRAYKVLQLPEGKLLVAGYTQKALGDYDFVLVRYNSNGSLDTSFSGDGILTTNFGGNPVLGKDQAFAAVEQSDQQIVLAGVSDIEGIERFALARYLFDDEDNDGVKDSEDNCPFVKNPDQFENPAEINPDGLGDACDPDDDNDGIPDDKDDCPLDPNESVDTDHDLICNIADPDDDNDGVLDGDDEFPLVGIFGQKKRDLLGYSVANAGDIDGDGFDDIIAGSPKSNPLLPGKTRPVKNAGSVIVYSGRTALPLENLTFTGDAAHDEFGIAVAGAGDVNNDGVPDIMVGAHKADVLDPVTQKILIKNAGRAVIYSGDGGAKLFDFYGEAAGDGLGISVSIIGDIDADGYDEVAAGSWKADKTDTVTGKKLKDTGAVYLYSGQTHSQLHKFEGENKRDYFGFAIAPSDVNNDGKPDIIIGAYRHDVKLPKKKMVDAGSAYIYSLTDFSLIRQHDGEHARDRLGYAVCGADLNNDGFGDVLLGAPLEDILDPVKRKRVRNSGGVHIYSGIDGNDLYPGKQINSDPQAGALFGSSLSAAGDFNNDALPDFVVGAYKYDALVKDIKIRNSGKVTVHSGSDGSEFFSISGWNNNNHYGFAVSGGGDQNRDAFSDVIIGAPHADPHFPDVKKPVRNGGIVEIITGRTVVSP